MQKRSIVCLLGLLAVILIFQPQTKAETERVTLKEQFKSGQSFKAVEQMNLEAKFEVMENVVALKYATGLVYSYTVKQVAAEGGWTVGLAIHSLFNETPGVMGLDASFDSTDLFALPQFNNVLSACLVGQEVELEIKPNGAVGNVKFSDAFLEWVLQYSKSNKTSLTKEQLQAQVMQSLSGRIAKPENSLEQGIFSGEPVAVGESWNKKVKMENAGLSLDFQTTYTLKQRLNGMAQIEVVAQIIGVNSESGNETYEYFNMTGCLKGTIVIIEACGWMHDFDLKFAIDGESRLKPTTTAGEGNNKETTAVTAEKANGGTGKAEAEDDATEAANAKFHIEASVNRKPFGEY